MGLGDVAAAIHRRMCDDERFGYSWEERWGANPERWDVGGKSLTINVGDYDCSSSTITAWKLALLGTPYEGGLDGASYTGNMRSVFVNSGLFEWKTMSFDAQPGDLYLNEANHVAMCQQNDSSADILSEFSSNESGGAYGGQRGDQTGWESHLTGFYEYPWDGILHYNGKADGTEDDMQANEVWEYSYKKSAPGGNVYNTLCFEIPGQLKALRATVEAQNAAIKALASANGADPEKVAAAVDKAVRERLEKINLTIDAGK